ncbi:MAG: dTDP-4-dehydrorhamnose reductase [Dehalococcoidia bacterium]
MRVLVFGANGQLGSDIVRLWSSNADIVLIPARRIDGDVTDAKKIARIVKKQRPDVVINTTAFHNLPVCESEPLKCFEVNVGGGYNVAAAAAEAGATVVQISTDYVFDGTKTTPYLEGDARHALNMYGAAKIATEDVVRIANPKHLVVRVSGLYGLAGSAGKGGNFVETMLRLAREGNPIRVVGDQVTSPTNTAEIAEALLPLVRDGATGVVHLAAAEGCSWHAFASEIFRLAWVSPDLTAVTTEEFGGPVKRPMFSVLGTTVAPPMRNWREGLARYMNEKHGIPL